MDMGDENITLEEVEDTVTVADPDEVDISVSKIEPKNRKSIFLSSTKIIIIYPKEFSKILMQLGYEPKSPVPSLTLLGRPCLLLPNIFSYVHYIMKVDGFLGCYRGVIPHLLRNSVEMYVSDTVCCTLDKYWKCEEISIQQSPSNGGGDISTIDTITEINYSEEDEDNVDFFTNFKAIVKDWIGHIAGIVASYPLRVIAVQTMAEFVGREEIMKRGFTSAVNNIYKEGGILGFYSGLAPRIIGETLHIFSIGCLGYFLRTKVGNDEGRALLSLSLNVLLGALVYPFNVVSTTMAVNGSGLMVGRNMPYYNSWLECWAHLSDLNQLRRGSSLIFRYYTGPTVLRNGVKKPYGMHFGPDFTTLSTKLS